MNRKHPHDFICQTCGKPFHATQVWENRIPKYCSSKCFANRGLTDITRQKMAEAKRGKMPWNKGVAMWDSRQHPKGTLGKKFPNKTFTETAKIKMSLAHIGKALPERSKENHWNWQGGIAKLNDAFRHSLEYKMWRRAVFIRDNYTCQECGQRGDHLHADHIKPFALFPTLRLVVSNGRTLCVKCHRKTPTYGVSKKVKIVDNCP